MELMEKLAILGEAARYDASCASSGSTRQGKKGSLGSTVACGVCHSWSADGRCVSLLKILLSNACIYNCAYCANRCGSNVPRATFTPDEVAKLTTEFYRRNYIEGLFLSSGVVKSPDYTMELMIEALTLLRGSYGFNGYVHVKVIPGASQELIQKLGLLADRVSVNIELPTSQSLMLLAPDKKRDAILTPMGEIQKLKEANQEERRLFKSAPLFAPSGQSTQMIVGATPDSDAQILRLSSSLYEKYQMKRVYFSAYVPVGRHPTLPPPDVQAPLLREHRLYQADWLMRFYKFKVEEIVEQGENLDEDLDPKASWALRHLSFFPVEVNQADLALLLRVPGIGPISAKRIVAARRTRQLEHSDLKRLGVVLKRANFFITCKGRYAGAVPLGSPFLRTHLVDRTGPSPQYTLPDFATPAALPAFIEG
jgi:putative DNA modification/repair radical SAM protein